MNDMLPPRVLPVLYYGLAHAALALAFAVIAADPRGVAGFFYHSRMLGIVHLVTLGWITASILGSLYVVGPMALRVQFAATWVDYTAFALVAVGTIGMVGHFWIQEYGGMAWSAGTVGTGVVIVGTKIVPRVLRAPIPRAVSAHIALAFVNIAGAATLGTLIGVDKVHHVLPGYVLANVFAHAHLAAIGWASMMVVGVAYRLMPMILPAQMAGGRRLWTSAVLIEGGVIGLFVCILRRSHVEWLFASIVIAGFGVFLSQIAWMMKHPRPRPPALPSPDAAVLHAGAAMVWLVSACALGLWLAIAGTSPFTLQAAAAYGVLGLLGFLAQIVVGMEGRLLPLLAWYWGSAIQKGRILAPHEMAWRGGQELVFVLWLFGVPALAGGLAFDAVPFVRAAAWSLLAATLLDSANAIRILRHAFVKPRP